MESFVKFFRPTFSCAIRFIPACSSVSPVRWSACFWCCAGWCSWAWRCRRFPPPAWPSLCPCPCGSAFNLPSTASHSEHILAFIGSMTFFAHRDTGAGVSGTTRARSARGRLGTGYVVAAALSILLLSKNRYAEIGWLDLLKGEVITISNFDLALTAAHAGGGARRAGIVSQGDAAGLI